MPAIGTRDRADRSMSLLQISDPHFGTEVPHVVAALSALTARLSPSLVVMSGDVTQRATEEQFQSASAFLRQLPAPASLVIGVNTVMPFWHKQGSVSDAQIERTCGLMRKASPKQIRAIVCHHPVHVIRKEDNKNLLRRADEAVRHWVAAGADLILGGHIHLPYFRPLKQRLPDLPRDAWALQAGTAVSLRIRQGIANSVNFVQPLAAATGAACRVERWDYSDREGAFRLIASEELTLSR
jgi:3',5'-cyclic AMP phosphodiesterase CpdA